VKRKKGNGKEEDLHGGEKKWRASTGLLERRFHLCQNEGMSLSPDPGKHSGRVDQGTRNSEKRRSKRVSADQK